MKNKCALSILLSFALALLSASALAENGDVLRTLIAERTGNCASYNEAGNHGSVGVGIAFDGAVLLISCYSDNTVAEIDPADGSLVTMHTISGASSLGALAWDQGRGLLWACSDYDIVGTINLASNTFTEVFRGADCFDGLAYDASDDTLWASGDARWPVTHYSTTGAELGSFSEPSGWAGSGNSGIGVGGDMLYLANNGSYQVYAVDKAGVSATLIFTSDRRLEGLECDNINFEGDGKTAMWTIDAYDNVLNAIEIPYGSCTYGGGDGNGRAMEPVPVMSRWAIAATLMFLSLFAWGYLQRRT